MTILWVITIVVALVVGTVAGYALAHKLMERQDRELDDLRKPRTDKQAQKIVESAGPVPSDLSVGPFLGDELAAEEHAERVRKNVQEQWEAGRADYFKPLLTLTKNEDANEVLYLVAVTGSEHFISNRQLAQRKGWGTRRVKTAIDYLTRNRYLRIEEASANKGNRYNLKPEVAALGAKQA